MKQSALILNLKEANLSEDWLWFLASGAGTAHHHHHHQAIWFNLNFATASRPAATKTETKEKLYFFKVEMDIIYCGVVATWVSCHKTRRPRGVNRGKVMMFCLSDVCYDCRITFSHSIYQTSDWTFLSSTQASEKIVTAAFFWPGVDVLIRIINEQKNWIRYYAP